MPLNYRLALDLGTNSIGWCVYRLAADDGAGEAPDRYRIEGIQRMGVRIFSDGRNPKDLASLAAARRQARQMRRRRDRALKRKQRLMEALIDARLMPGEPQARQALVGHDPYVLRARGLDQALELTELGRAIFHLARKRGFRSGRKDYATDEKEAGKIRAGIERLREQLRTTGARTVGEYLARRHAQRKPVLARPGADGEYAIYPSRELVAEEFDLLWETQRRWHPSILNDAAKAKIRDIILFQRPLRPVKPGKCLFEPEEDRALLAHPLSQRFRILQELANLRFGEDPTDKRPLTATQRDILLEILANDESMLDAKKQLTWARIRSILGLRKGTPFNLDVQGRSGLKADAVSIALAKPEAVGPEWRAWTPERQDVFLKALRTADRRDEVAPKLEAAGFSLPDEKIDAIFACAARMPDEFGQLSLKALARVVPCLEAGVVHYDEAVREAGYGAHSDFYDGEILPRLPYYGERLQGYVQPHDVPGATEEERRFGRIANPTVHVGLNQLRRVVNAIVRRYGRPGEIIVEVARELGLSGQNRRKLMREQEENRARNESLGAELERLRQPNNRENRQRLRLFQELIRKDALDAECIYTGERIGYATLFSSTVEIDHLLPFSRSLDDGIGNKVLCVRRANRDKGQRTPYEAFGSSPNGYSWEAILERAKRLAPKKSRRFTETALEDFLDGRDFLDRHLTDTAYFSRVARAYLVSICPPNRVWVSTGRVTAMVRARLGLNRLLSDSGVKERLDHRHHAVDAAVIGACDRRLIRAVATAANRAELEGESRLLARVEPPWPAFVADVASTLERIVVSHKPDHGLGGALHNETAYGIVGGPDKKRRPRVAHTVPITSLTKAADLESLADKGWVRRELEHIFATSTDKASLKTALQALTERRGVRRVRVEQRLAVQEIRNPHRDAAKFVKTDSNYCYDVFRKANGRWAGYAVPLFEANRKGLPCRGEAFRGEPLVMRLHVDDTVRALRPGASREELFRVVKVSDGSIALAAVQESGNLKARNEDDQDPFRYWLASPTSLHGGRARVVGVDELGYVNDAGFRE